jgi:putative Ca2+/H+ antiporter (TMEM165/GDT1 family)
MLSNYLITTQQKRFVASKIGNFTYFVIISKRFTNYANLVLFVILELRTHQKKKQKNNKTKRISKKEKNQKLRFLLHFENFKVQFTN